LQDGSEIGSVVTSATMLLIQLLATTRLLWTVHTICNRHARIVGETVSRKDQKHNDQHPGD